MPRIFLTFSYSWLFAPNFWHWVRPKAVLELHKSNVLNPMSFIKRTVDILVKCAVELADVLDLLAEDPARFDLDELMDYVDSLVSHLSDLEDHIASVENVGAEDLRTEFAQVTEYLPPLSPDQGAESADPQQDS